MRIVLGEAPQSASWACFMQANFGDSGNRQDREISSDELSNRIQAHGTIRLVIWCRSAQEPSLD
ncbi:hypothetical protein Rhsp01_05360 [Rhizobium sp. NBRC 114257]|nr:hypothetical protein Rhsp01_05360 [Rhizobium sp. NBRC 114257]